MDDQTLALFPDDFDEARMAVEASFSMGRRSARECAEWASEDLAPGCGPGALARSARRSHFLAQGAAAAVAVQGAESSRWAMSAPTLAEGWAMGLGLSDRVQDAAGLLPELHMAMARSGLARETARQALFAIIGADPEDLPALLSRLSQWYADVFEPSGSMAFISAAQAMMGLRESYAEARSEQGATDADLERARAAGAELLSSLRPDLRELARDEYLQHVPALAPFAEAFMPWPNAELGSTNETR